LYRPFSQSVHEANVAAILENGHPDKHFKWPIGKKLKVTHGLPL